MHGELCVRNLIAGYGQRNVLRSVTATFLPGRITCLLGSNGAGKTTALRTLAGYLPQRSGSIHYADIDLSQLLPRDRARYIACVPQVGQDAVPLTVREAVSLARFPHLTHRLSGNGGDSQIIDDALETMELTQLTGRSCTRLSGGEWRRVLIAQGLAQATPVLLLDEPTAFLDPPARRRILHRVRELAAGRSLTVVMVLHDLELATEYAAEVQLMREGRIIAAGAPGDVLTTERLAQLYDCEPEWLCRKGSTYA